MQAIGQGGAPGQAMLTRRPMSAKRNDVSQPATQPPVSLIERALLAYARRSPIPFGKYRLIDRLWHHGAGSNHHREAKLIYGGFRMSCDIGEMIQRQLYFFGTYYLEKPLLAVWQAKARDAQVIFDVGANAGIYSLAALAANPKAGVHAFEPTPEIAERLRTTKLANSLPGLTIAEVAVSDSAGHANLVRFDGGGSNGGMNYIGEAPVAAVGQRVATIRLDDYCRDNRIDRIDLIKVDVQGLEPNVFRGAEDLLSKGKIGTIFVELNWGNPDHHSSADELIALLERFGYQFSEICAAPQWRPSGAWLRLHADIMARPMDGQFP
jgi:FkbM family methyltransferase